jgi:hypothetical protein
MIFPQVVPPPHAPNTDVRTFGWDEIGEKIGRAWVGVAFYIRIQRFSATFPAILFVSTT